MVMSEMGIHVDFIKMVEIMYKDATLKNKDNSHVGEDFHPTNGVAQESPLLSILYLLVIQSCISLLNISPDVEGIFVPGAGGDESNCRNTDQLPPFRALLAMYENASGAVNSWPKTFGFRVGTLRGSNILPVGV